MVKTKECIAENFVKCPRCKEVFDAEKKCAGLDMAFQCGKCKTLYEEKKDADACCSR